MTGILSNVGIFILLPIIIFGLFIRYQLLNEFDKHFLPKYKLYYYRLASVLVSSLLLTPIIWMIAYYIGFITESLNWLQQQYMTVLGFIIFPLLLLLLLLSDTPIKRTKKNIIILLLKYLRRIAIKFDTNILGYLVAFSLTLLVSTIFSEKIYNDLQNDEGILEVLLVQFIAVFIMTLIVMATYNFLILPLSSSKKYIITVQIDNTDKNFFVYYTLDKNILVLGEEEHQSKCSTFYLYDMKSKEYTKFTEKGNILKDKINS